MVHGCWSKLVNVRCDMSAASQCAAVLRHWVASGIRNTVAVSLKRDLGKVSEWCDLCGMKLNASKTMIVSRPPTMHPPATPINYRWNCAE